MADINVEYINVFLKAAAQVMKDVCQMNLSIGRPYVKQTEFENETVVVNIGITGQLRGLVLLAMPKEVACDIASRMCAATVLSTKGIIVDITPPSIIQGSFKLSSAHAKNICVPLSYDSDRTIELDISIKKED